MDMLKDGTGKGFLAKVNRYNRLSVDSVNITEEQFVSYTDREAYFANTAQTADVLAITATGGPVLHISNLSTTNMLFINKIIVTNSVAGTVFKWLRNTVVGTIGNNNVMVPVNANFSSSNTANATCYSWNQVGDGMTGITNGSIGVSFILGVGTLVLPLDGSIVLGVGNAITL